MRRGGLTRPAPPVDRRRVRDGNSGNLRGSSVEVPLALLADAANVSREGKLNVLGVFNSISSPQFPTLHPMMQLVLGFEAGVAETGMDKAVAFVLLNAEGEEQMRMEGTITVPTNAPGRRAHWYQIIPLSNTIFAEPGDYQISVLVQGDTKAEIGLIAALTEPDEEAQEQYDDRERLN